jgi:hypothetical protein
VAEIDLATMDAERERIRATCLHESGTSIYFRDPNGARLELIADPLGEMYGQHVL